MSKTQHTPGPWVTDGGAHVQSLYTPADGGAPFYHTVARVDQPLASPDSASANARLIAAAPDLLGALAALIHLAETMTAELALQSDPSELVAARAAIAEALGERKDAPAKPVITPVDQAGSHKTGSLPDTLTSDDITAVLGFPPNVADDSGKVAHSWGFTVSGVRCGIWDYNGSRWSTFDPENLLPGLFAKVRGENADLAA